MSTQTRWEGPSINEMLFINLAGMHHLARKSSALPVLEVMAEDGPAEAQTLTVVVDFLYVLVGASRAADALASQEIEADIRVEELVLIASIHGRWKVAVL